MAAGRLALAGGRRRWQGRTGARYARLDALNRQPLPNLYEVHPEARNLVRREVGIRSVPVDEIVGTAVAGVDQRGRNFLPLPAFKSTNWQYRWQGIRRAMDAMAILPPIDLLRHAEGYWVEDGHNRVAAALYQGQVEIDANVMELVAPGAYTTLSSDTLAPVLESTRELRSAAQADFAHVEGEVHPHRDEDA